MAVSAFCRSPRFISLCAADFCLLDIYFDIKKKKNNFFFFALSAATGQFILNGLLDRLKVTRCRAGNQGKISSVANTSWAFNKVLIVGPSILISRLVLWCATHFRVKSKSKWGSRSVERGRRIKRYLRWRAIKGRARRSLLDPAVTFSVNSDLLLAVSYYSLYIYMPARTRV